MAKMKELPKNLYGRWDDASCDEVYVFERIEDAIDEDMDVTIVGVYQLVTTKKARKSIAIEE